MNIYFYGYYFVGTQILNLSGIGTSIKTSFLIIVKSKFTNVKNVNDRIQIKET
jgi:hypothetical protein